MSTTRADAGGSSYHHGNLRPALLERAAQTIETDGVESLSLRQLARDLGVSHAAPGRHFRDKQALLDALAYDGFVALNERLDAALATPGTVGDRLGAMARAHVAFAVERRGLVQVMDATRRSPDVSPRLREVGHAGLAKTADLLRAAQATGEVIGGDPDRLALAAFAAVHGLAALATSHLLDGVPLDEATTATAALVRAGLTAAPAAPTAPPPPTPTPDRAPSLLATRRYSPGHTPEGA
ncbi:TetR/AcrR family transcriptional regulator [Herbiconiux sp. CPCC 205763]|uniref:TetR/AcrR family transcriptional regulator n=1 Tax=Herbiconiux aconitum TaxID=2970913 RepID=A0ABT2GM43_9MICO|nr:TetR/AcrR family transcriptional regulator [Herbiconiux aconitum]MCS5717298.1 TetR/AcrR family transcriptional regulator [Herbiconiux aconitum]